jgi:transcriptional regulator with XRE-family HTH domain
MSILKKLRRAVGLTQQELAKLAGINRAYLAQIEVGIHKPSPILEKWLIQVIESYHLSQQSIIMRLSDHDRPSEETIRVREELDTLKEKDLGKLVTTQVVVRSLHNKVDWQIMSGLAALHIFKLFPGSLELKFL